MPNNAPEYQTRPAVIAYERSRQKARQRAYRRLAMLHAPDFERLLSQEMEGVVRPSGRIPNGPPRTRATDLR